MKDICKDNKKDDTPKKVNVCLLLTQMLSSICDEHTWFYYLFDLSCTSRGEDGLWKYPYYCKKTKIIYFGYLLWIFLKSPYTRTKHITPSEELILIWGKALAQHFQYDIANKVVLFLTNYAYGHPEIHFVFLVLFFSPGLPDTASRWQTSPKNGLGALIPAAPEILCQAGLSLGQQQLTSVHVKLMGCLRSLRAVTPGWGPEIPQLLYLYKNVCVYTYTNSCACVFMHVFIKYDIHKVIRCFKVVQIFSPFKNLH